MIGKEGKLSGVAILLLSSYALSVPPQVNMATLTSAEISSIAVSLTLRWLAMRSAQPLSAWSPGSGRLSTPQDAIRLAQGFSRKSTRSNSTRSNARAGEGDRLLRTVDAVNEEIDRYEVETLQQKALDSIPSYDIHARAEILVLQVSKDAATPKLAYQDALAQALVEWAKQDFLRWVDPVRCSGCSSDTEGCGSGTPSQVEQDEGRAGRVELYRCTRKECQGRITRFPRYSKLEKLLETRTGRCGEFAAIFMLLLRALGFRARYVWNSEDHVWNEYYSDALQRWVHIDSCESARGKELLYDIGWGKKMRYCIAFGPTGASDVTRAYVSDWPATLSMRDRIAERDLQAHLAGIRQRRRAHLAEGEREDLRREDAAEEQWLQNASARLEAAKLETMSGRTSGTKKWRKQRSELGREKVSAAQPFAGTIRGCLLLSVNVELISGAGILLCDLRSSSLTCNGSARVDQEGIELTSDGPGQTGSVFLQLLPTSSGDVTITFAFSMSSSAGSGADGIAFVIHSAPDGVNALGKGGCDLGYGGLKSSVAVELDTYRSQDRCNDPPTPHISIHSRGHEGNDAHHRSSLWCTSPGALPDLADGRTYRLRLVFSGGYRSLQIWFTDSAAGEDFEELTGGPVQLPDYLSEQKFIGWTASTGGLHQAHRILSFEVRSTEAIAKDGI